MVVGRDLNGHAQELDGTGSDEVDGQTKKAKFGVKGPCCRPLESQAVALGDLSLHATPLQPTSAPTKILWQLAGPSPIKQVLSAYCNRWILTNW